MTAFNKAWGVVKGDSCLTCGKKIDNPDEIEHHHGHAWDSLSGPYCDQDCWVAGEKYNPHSVVKEVRLADLVCPDCSAEWYVDSISEKEQLRPEHRICPKCDSKNGVVRYWDMVDPDTHEDWMEDGD